MSFIPVGNEVILSQWQTIRCEPWGSNCHFPLPTVLVFILRSAAVGCSENKMTEIFVVINMRGEAQNASPVKQVISEENVRMIIKKMIVGRFNQSLLKALICLMYLFGIVIKRCPWHVCFWMSRDKRCVCVGWGSVWTGIYAVVYFTLSIVNI